MVQRGTVLPGVQGKQKSALLEEFVCAPPSGVNVNVSQGA